jgi:hypothetical protein
MVEGTGQEGRKEGSSFGLEVCSGTKSLIFEGWLMIKMDRADLAG